MKSSLYGQQIINDTIIKAHKIKTVTKQTFFGDKATPSMTYKEWYNKDGKALTLIWINNNFNFLEVRQFFFYDKKGRLKKEKYISYEGKDSTITFHTYDYDKDGDLMDWTKYGKVAKPIIKHTYDTKGKIQETIETISKNQLKTVYQYDSLNRRVEEINIYNNIKTSSVLNIYNSKNELEKRLIYSYTSDKKIERQTEEKYDYDPNGLLIKDSTKIIIAKTRDDINMTYTYEYGFE